MTGSERRTARERRAAALLRDVDRLDRASWLELRLEGHHHATIGACEGHGWLKPIRWHAPKPYHWEITREGRELIRATDREAA